jgi:hypothetical protein
LVCERLPLLLQGHREGEFTAVLVPVEHVGADLR